jgi:hypothetical protein
LQQLQFDSQFSHRSEFSHRSQFSQRSKSRSTAASQHDRSSPPESKTQQHACDRGNGVATSAKISAAIRYQLRFVVMQSMPQQQLQNPASQFLATNALQRQ